MRHWIGFAAVTAKIDWQLDVAGRSGRRSSDPGFKFESGENGRRLQS